MSKGVNYHKIKVLKTQLRECHHRMAQLMKQSRPNQVKSMEAQIKKIEKQIEQLTQG
jgi:hypothetical protein